jgi:hypothetical protein
LNYARSNAWKLVGKGVRQEYYESNDLKITPRDCVRDVYLVWDAVDTRWYIGDKKPGAWDLYRSVELAGGDLETPVGRKYEVLSPAEESAHVSALEAGKQCQGQGPAPSVHCLRVAR